MDTLPETVTEEALAQPVDTLPETVTEEALAQPAGTIAGGTISLTGPGFAAELDAVTTPAAGTFEVSTEAGSQEGVMSTENGDVNVTSEWGAFSVPAAQVEQVRDAADAAYNTLPTQMQQTVESANAQLVDAVEAQPEISHYTLGLVNATVVVDHLN